MTVILSIINTIGNVPAVAWASIFAMVGVSAFQEKLKHWLEIENPKVLVFMTTVFALAGAIIPAMLGIISANPTTLAGNSALWFTGLTLAYRYIIQPGGSALNGWKADMNSYKTYKSNLQPAIVAPIEGSNPQIDALAKEVATPAAVVEPTAPVAAVSEFQG